MEDASPSTTELLDNSAVMFPIGVYSSEYIQNPLVIERREGSLPVIPKVLNHRIIPKKKMFASNQIGLIKVEKYESK